MEHNNPPAIVYSTAPYLLQLYHECTGDINCAAHGCAAPLWYQSSAHELSPLKQKDSALLGKYLLPYTDGFLGCICFFEFKS